MVEFYWRPPNAIRLTHGLITNMIIAQFVAVGAPHVKNRSLQIELTAKKTGRDFFLIIWKLQQMQFKKLDQSFYSDNMHLVQVLDKLLDHWIRSKERGYGIFFIKIKILVFGLPLRSNINHKAASIITKSDKAGIRGKGLDFSKAVLLGKPEYIPPISFKIAPMEHKKLKNKEIHITDKFEKYVAGYIKAINGSDKNRLNCGEYRFTSLQNYHRELGISNDAQRAI